MARLSMTSPLVPLLPPRVIIRTYINKDKRERGRKAGRLCPCRGRNAIYYTTGTKEVTEIDSLRLPTNRPMSRPPRPASLHGAAGDSRLTSNRLAGQGRAA